MGAWMRQYQLIGPAELVAESDQVQVKRPRLVAYLLGLSTKLAFKCLQFPKQRFGSFTRERAETYNYIHEWR